MTHISAVIFGRRKSLVKPVMQQKTCNLVFPPEIVIHDAYISGRSENNIKYVVVHNDLRRKTEQLDNCRFSAASLALQVIFCFTVVEHIRFFHGAIQI